MNYDPYLVWFRPFLYDYIMFPTNMTVRGHIQMEINECEAFRVIMKDMWNNDVRHECTLQFVQEYGMNKIKLKFIVYDDTDNIYTYFKISGEEHSCFLKKVI